MDLTVDQILALAPDSSSAAAGKKVGAKKNWKSAARNELAVWGECQGSALYQVRVDLTEFAYRCSCPSRKLPCKHVLGLLLLAAGSPKEVPNGEPPEWVTDWLAQRAARTQKREERKAEPGKTADPAAQAKRTEQRQVRVAAGLDRLDVWLGDLARNGLAGLERQDVSLWETQAKRLVDSQAPGLAARVRRLGEIPGASRDWPRILLAELGRLALLSHAYRRIEELEPGMQADLKQMVGWTVSQEELAALGETVADRWLVLGQWVEDEDRVRVQRSWLLGASTRRPALVLQFSAGGQPFPEMIVPGTCTEGDLAYWPGLAAQRARFLARRGETARISGGLPGVASIEEFLAATAAALARQPWLDRFLCVLKGVTPVFDAKSGSWLMRDGNGAAMPLVRREHWQLLALSGGLPVDFAAQWDGQALLPLGVCSDDTYYLLIKSA